LYSAFVELSLLVIPKELGIIAQAVYVALGLSTLIAEGLLAAFLVAFVF
jgi:hypothetical protein